MKEGELFFRAAGILAILVKICQHLWAARMRYASSLDSGLRQKVAGARVATADGRHDKQTPCTAFVTFSMAGALGCFKGASETPNAELALWQATTPGQGKICGISRLSP
jgi:ribosomal protein S12 methylthiotransferase accessory factor YcaO